jgi:non-haem Fe2+, alpha-ketoglutarate-dependent halogenase
MSFVTRPSDSLISNTRSFAMLALPISPASTLERFSRDGFVGPFALDVPRGLLDRVAARVDDMLERQTQHPLYGRFSVRDWHLLDEEMLSLLSHPHIAQTVAAILGPDLLLWRSKVFVKRPGEAPLGWHQEWGAFNGEEIGNDRPALLPATHAQDRPWNLTVWVALDDVTPDMGPIRFARGTHVRRFPIEMQPLVNSEFWHDPFLDTASVEALIARADANALVLDIRTDHIFKDVDRGGISLDEAKTMVLEGLRGAVGAVTLGFDPKEHEIVDLPMKAGSFVVFSERTMHGSSSNDSPRRRLAVNARYTRSDTLVYPFREQSQRIDGSNLDISRHECVLVSGRQLTSRNVLRRMGHPEQRDA